jgi:tRNA(Arg) A34 adenosine deaminase TadA
MYRRCENKTKPRTEHSILVSRTSVARSQSTPCSNDAEQAKTQPGADSSLPLGEREKQMNSEKHFKRQKLPSAPSNIAGTAAPEIAAAPASGGDAPLPEGIHPGNPLAQYWRKAVFQLIDVKLPPEELTDVAKERHRIFSLLLMALIVRFWNGNNNGPLGIYPQRQGQLVPDQDLKAEYLRYKGDLHVCDDPQRICWDHYLGHNIACLAVDGKGEVMDFDFNHNNFFRSTAEHAESRMVRRLFSLADIMDEWKTGRRIPGRAKAFTLKDVTIYTSLESCAQCSGVMSLGRVKQVVYLQNDPGAYRVGNIIYNLAGRENPGDGSALAALPIPVSEIGLPYLDQLNREYEKFCAEMAQAEAQGDKTGAYFLPKKNGVASYTQSITSFLCTDAALHAFKEGETEFHTMTPKHADRTFPEQGEVWSNPRCLEEARKFYTYADVEGFRGSPHKL